MSEETPKTRSTDERATFIPYSHPSQTVTIDYPEHWAIEAVEQMVVGIELQSPEVREACAGIFIMPYQLPIAKLKQDELQKLLHTCLEGAGATKSDPSPLMYYPARCGRTKDGCHTWMIAHEDVIFALQIHYPEELEHIYRPLFERMLSSFRIHRSGAGERLQLIQDVLEQLTQRCPELKFENDGRGIQGDNFTIGVDNLAALIARQPMSRDQIIAEFAESVARTCQQTKSMHQESWEDAQAKVLPMVRQDKLLTVFEEQASQSQPEIADQQRLVWSPWLANLIVCYAVDSELSLRMINMGDLERWQIDASQLHEQAIVNLTGQDFPSMMGAAAAGGELSVGLLAEGGISTKSSYVFHPQLLDKLKQHFSGGMWIAIPSRDSLVVLSKSIGNRQMVMEMVAQDFNSSDNPISDRLFEPTPDGLTLG